MEISDRPTLSRAEHHFAKALLSLMDKKDYKKITVQELSEEAQFDRRTYYRYFTSKEDILELYCSYILNDMAVMMQKKGPLTFRSGIVSYFAFWESHMDFLSLLEKNGMLHFLANHQDELLYYAVGKSVQPGIPVQLEDASPFSRYSFYFISGGLWNALVHWVKEKQRRTPEELTDYILTCFKEIDDRGSRSCGCAEGWKTG
ncbi:MAG: TetR/AcrR family transcriptional regulator [Lachnospiraceae bacterium]